MQTFTCSLYVVWKLLPSSQNLSCLAQSCLKPEGARQQDWAQDPLVWVASCGQTHGARAIQSQSSSQVGERIQRSSERKG